jgi:hypothetical protein
MYVCKCSRIGRMPHRSGARKRARGENNGNDEGKGTTSQIQKRTPNQEHCGRNKIRRITFQDKGNN